MTHTNINTNPKIDNRTTNKCKSIIVIKQHQNASAKQPPRHTRSISIRIKNISSSRNPLNSSREGISRNSNKIRLQEGDNFLVRLDLDPAGRQLQQAKRQQKLRRQLESSRLDHQQILKKNSQILKTKQSFYLTASNKLRNMKEFTFGYDFGIMKANLNHSQNQIKQVSSQRSGRRIPEMRIKVSNQGKNKSRQHVKSMPQINYVQKVADSKLAFENNHKLKNYRRDIFIQNQQQNQSLLEALRSQSSIKKGVTIKQNVDGHTIKFQRDTINTRSLFDLKKSQFQQSTERKRFLSKYYKPQQIFVKSAIKQEYQSKA